jgi:hypothetical protein
MNQKAEESVNYFFNLVGMYMKAEYEEKYSDRYGHIPTIHKMRNIVARYYWGGNSVPDTAGIMVEYFKQQGI